MSRPKTATMKIAAIYLYCPHCGEGIESPDTGAFVIYGDDHSVTRGKMLDCGACGESVRVPKTPWDS